ncbi:hypothetical protein [Dyella nitratireducens]|uniref:Uncharacterized protein n=1 Tax=Dyella nitratireducens TaxID=1849580 RepID=A0ABQ1GF39_9GAMM|nr:hypothetical protein [Dyella nitratireducens]GGA42424.1 hypothetical protein GCM10010981_34400 [Dyella nitratireducens]GLQ42003.1 hypothetical protein GCM10007902_18530 [Dyella nitratireducens]
MFGSIVLEAAIGMIVCFGSVALIASSLQEAMASLLRMRARTLLKGVDQLLNGHPLVLDIYNHALVNPRSNGRAESIGNLSMKLAPSYIVPINFARAMVDSLDRGQVTFGNLRPVLEGISDVQIRTCLCSMYDRAAGSTANFEAEIAQWFDSAMDRISGAYKRHAQCWAFILALTVAIAFNIDASHVLTHLWTMSATGVLHLPVTGPATDVAGAFSSLGKLPIGWSAAPGFGMAMIAMIPGWLITASSSLFGAPFWFGLLGKVTNLRGAGDKPNNA